MSKYNNKRVFLTAFGELLKGTNLASLPPMAGIWFDSELEARYYRDVLHPKVATGDIEDVEVQPTYVLLKAFEKNGIKHRAITYSPDFRLHYPDGRVEVIDIKGHENDRFPLKRKMFDHEFRDTPLHVIKYCKKFGGWISAETYTKEKAKERKTKQTPVRPNGRKRSSL